MKPRRILSALRLSFPLASAIAALLAAQPAFALTYYWDNNGTTAGFGTAAGTWAAPTTGSATQGWSQTAGGTVLPVNVTTATGDTVNFGNGATGLAAGTITVSGPVSTGNMTFASGSGAITLSGSGTISIGGSRTIATAYTAGVSVSHAITAPLALSGATIVAIGDTGAGGGTRTLTLGAMSGTGGLSMGYTGGNNGTGLIVLNGACTYSGTTTINCTLINANTEVRLGVNDALPTSTILTIGGVEGTGSPPGRKTQLNLNGRSQTLAGLATTGGGNLRTQNVFSSTAATLTINDTGNRTFAGLIGNGGTNVSVVKQGAGIWTLSGANTYIGQTTISAGTITLASAAALGTTAGNTVVSSGGRVFVGTANLTVAEPFNIAGTGPGGTTGAINIGGGATTTGVVFSGGITLSGDATIQGDGSTSSTYSGGINLGSNTLTFKEAGTITVGTTGISGVGGSLIKNTGGNLNLSASNSYTGSTQINAGSISLTGAGSINSTSGITLSGSAAKFVQSSSVAVSPGVTLTQGTVTGSGTVNTVNVGDATGGIISNNDGIAGAALTIGTLTFNGTASVNTFGTASAPIIATTLNTPATGTITITPSAANWAAGTYDLISYGSMTGPGLSSFVLGSIPGLTPRQSKVLGDSSTAITLTIGADDTPYWSGDGDGKWNLASTSNWKLLSDNSPTLFIAADNALFNDSATGAGPITVDIDTANVATTTTTFNNSAKDYVLNGAFGISAGSLTKSGTSALTINTANSYAGATTVNGGVLAITNATALGTVAAGTTVASGAALELSGNITVGAEALSLSGTGVSDGGALRNTSGTNTYGGLLTLGAATRINSDSGTLTLSNAGTITGATFGLTVGGAGNTAINSIIGTGSGTLTKEGAGTLNLTGANTFTGNTTISAGTLSMGANRVSGSPTIFIGDGATLQSSAGLTLSASQTITGTGTTGFVTTSNAGLITTSGTTISTSGSLTFSRLDFRGTGNVISGGNIQSGSTASNMRGLLVANGSTSNLTITGGTLTTRGGATNYDTIANTNAAGAPNGTLTINGGAYVNTASNGKLMLGNTGTLQGSATLTLTAGSATIHTLEYNLGSFAGNTGTVNLDGGTLTVSSILSTAGTNRIFNFNGGQLTAGANVPAVSNLTMNVKNGGASINTNGFSFAIDSPLLSDGTGGLTKSGLGTLTLAGANTYVGGTSVTAGTLRFSSAGSSTSDVSVDGGAEAGALVATTDGQWVNTGNLTLQNNGAALIDYGSTAPSITVAPIKVANFANGTTPGVKLAGSTLSTLAVSQTYPLVTWTGTGPVDGSAFDLRTHRLSGTFSVSSNTLFLTVSSNTIAPISWNTGNGNWDTSTANWVDSNLAATAYVDTLDSVLFGDASGASGNPTVTLATTVSPLSVTMNTTGRNYTVSGAGSISGSGALTLAPTNTGTFTLATANNSFTGGTVINGGTLALGDATNTLPDTGTVTVDGLSAILSLGSNSDTVGAVSLKGGASITGSGTLTGTSYALENGNVSALLGGAGTLTKSTTGTVILSAANPFTGATSISGGTLRLANTAALANTSLIGLTVANTRLEFGTDSAFTALPGISASSNLTHTIVSDRDTAGTALNHQLGTFNFGAATFNFIQGSNVSSGSAGLTFVSATMSSGSSGTTILNPTTAALSITGGVTSITANVARTLQLDGTGTGHSIGGVVTQSVASALTLSKRNTSTWTLSGLSSTAADNYSGATIIDQGTLALTTTSPSLTGGLTFGAAANSVNTGTLDLSGVASSATFTGAMLVQTNSVTPNSITLAAGKTLTVNGGLTMSNSTNNAETRLTMTGGGALVVNGATMTVGSNSGGTSISGEAHLNVAALDSFTTNLSGNLIIQAVGDNSASNPASITLSNVANSITAASVLVGNSSTGSPNNLWLGSGTNVIQTNQVNLGNGSRDSGIIDFAGIGGSVTLRNVAGTGRVGNVNLGVQTTQATGYSTANLVDLTGNTADVAIGTFATSLGAKSAANTNDLRFDTGTLDLLSINMAFAKGTGASTNRITIGGGTVNLGGSAAFSDAGTGTLTLATAGSGELIINGGTVNSTASLLKGTAGTGTATITLNGGTLDMGSTSIGAATDIVVLNAQSGTLQNVAQVNNGAGWTKSTTGTLTLAGTNAYTGAATVNAGILSVTGTLNPVSTLAVGGGTLSFAGAAPQAVAGLTVNSGSSTVTNTNAGATNILSLGPITRNAGGIVNFANATATDNVIQTSTTNTNGILGAWAFVGSDLAMVDGGNNIVAYTAYSDVARLNPGTIVDDSTTNVRIIEGSGTPGNITLGAATTTINTLLQSDSGGTSAATLDVSSSTLRTGGIVMLSAAGALTVGTAPNSGTLTTATAGGDLSLNNSSGNPMTINSAIADNTSASTLTKAGVGTVILNGTNTYTGTTTVTEGTLRLGGTSASASVNVTNGTLQAAGNLPATTAVTLGSTSTFDLFGASQTVATLVNAAGNTITNSNTGAHASTATTSGSPTLTDALTISAPVNTGVPALITDGPTRKTQIVMSNNNATLATSNPSNAYSGGLVLAHEPTNGTRLIVGTITGTPYGTGPIIIGQTNTDKAGIFFNAANQTLPNDIVVNTAVGTDRVGIRLDAIGTILSGRITANLAPITFSSNTTGAATLTGKITGSQGLTLSSSTSGAAITIKLNNTAANNDYAGDTVIGQSATAGRNRTLILGAADQIPNGTGTGNVVINTNGTGVGTLDLAGFSETINGLSGNGIVDGTSGTPTLTLGDNNATGQTFSGVIRNTAGTLSLLKNGSGTQTLSGANTYAGSTTVNAGTLVLGNGSALGTAPATVNGGSLDLGTQTIANTLAIGASGTLTGAGFTGAAALAGSVTPGGTGSGLITFSSASIASTSSINLQLAAAGARGTNYDAITVSGALALDGTITVSLNGLTPAGGQSFDLIDSTGPIDVTNFTVATDLILPTLGAGLAWDTSTFATDGVVSIVTTDPYLPWAASKGLTGGNNAKSADPDNDGKNNLYEFAFDGNPLSGADDGKVVGKIATVGADQVLTLTLPVRTGAAFSASGGDQLSALIDSIIYRVEGDADLGTFANTITEVTGGDATTIQTGLPTLSTGWTYRTFRDAGTVPTVPKAFLRAKISE